MSKLITALFFISWLISLSNQQSINDLVCTTQATVLCLKDELENLMTIIKDIIDQSTMIEKHIEQNATFHILQKIIKREMRYTSCYSPISNYHKNFFNQNNIDTRYFNELLIEAHDAMIFFTNSIVDLLDSEHSFKQQMNEEFEKIYNLLIYQLICRYRNVLKFFSLKWKSIQQIGRFHFSNKLNLPSSSIHDVHSIVIARYLREWMEQINQVLLNFEMKFFIQ